jgi:hypothetical protein
MDWLIQALKGYSHWLLVLSIVVPIGGGLAAGAITLLRVAVEKAERADRDRVAIEERAKKDAEVQRALLESDANAFRLADRSAALELQLQAAGREIETLRSFREPRGVTKEQAAAMLAVIKPSGVMPAEGFLVPVQVPMAGDGEIVGYGNALRDVLRLAGWKSQSQGTNVHARGLEVRVSMDGGGPVAEVLVKAFKAAGIEFSISKDPQLTNPHTTSLAVGPR